jgi:hypothetical protein
MNFKKLRFYLSFTILTVSLIAAASYFNLNSLGKLGFATTLTDEVRVTARVCRTIEDSFPTLNSLEHNQCNLVSWTGVDFIFGYPNCEFTENPVYILQISTTSNFSNIIYTNSISSNSIDINNLPLSSQYYYRIRVFDPDRPEFLSSWSEVQTCSTDYKPPLLTRPSIISGSKPTSEVSAPTKPVIFSRITKFDKACAKQPRPNPQSFTDLSPTHWAYDTLKMYYDYNIIDGYNDATIRPDQPITRAEALKIILNIPCEPLIYASQFQLYSDTQLNQWYSNYIWTATVLGIVSGYDNTSLFGPHNYSTRAEALKMTLNSFLPRDEVNKSYYQYATNRYLDVFKQDWFYSIVNFAYHNKIGFGSQNNMFRPNHYITRAEFVSIIDDTVDYNWSPN